MSVNRKRQNVVGSRNFPHQVVKGRLVSDRRGLDWEGGHDGPCVTRIVVPSRSPPMIRLCWNE